VKGGEVSDEKQPWWKTVDPTTPLSELIAKHQASQPRIVPAWRVFAQGLFVPGFSEVVHTEPEAEVVAEKALKDGAANVAPLGIFGGSARRADEPPTVFIQACYALETLEGLAPIGEPSFAMRVRLKDGGGLVMVPWKEGVK
jgi:hypothetical protein